ncbi:MAG: TolC family protein [Candidatus Riflebacteria bacterium]|nr:TolC family protein [Candidatus Riflebacteria bacterium]
MVRLFCLAMLFGFTGTAGAFAESSDKEIPLPVSGSTASGAAASCLMSTPIASGAADLRLISGSVASGGSDFAPVSTGIASSVADAAAGEHALKAFAAALVSGNRAIAASHHDREAARQDFGKQLTGFRPKISIEQGAAQSTNSIYNTLSGQDEDYASKQRGTTIGVSSKSPIGQTRLNLETSTTGYTQAPTSYFQSAYLSLQAGILRRDAVVNHLERRLDTGRYRLDQARGDSVLLDTMYDGVSALIDRLIAEGNNTFRLRNLDFYRKMIEEAQVKFDNGLGSELDVKQARMRLTIAETDLEESRLTLEEADRKIGLLLGTIAWDRSLAGISPGDLAAIVPEAIVEEDMASTSIRLRPDLRLIALERENAETSLRLACENAKPDISLAAKWGRQGRANASDLARRMHDKSWDISVTYSRAIGANPESFDRRSEIERVESVKIHQNETLESVKRSITETCNRIRFNRKNLADVQASQKLSAEILDGQRLNFQLGKISLLDLWRYQSDYESTSLSVIRAEATLAKSWMELLYRTGDLPCRLAAN